MVARKIAKQLSEKFHTKISIERARYGLKRNLILQHFLVNDQQSDTLIYIERLELKLKKLDIVHKQIDMERFEVKKLCTKFNQLNDSTFNYSFILNQLNSQGEDPFDWKISLEDFEISNNCFVYQTGSESYFIKQLTAHLTDFVYDSTSMVFNLNRFSFGSNILDIQNVAFAFYLDAKKISFQNLNVLSNKSYVAIDNFFINKGNKNQFPVFHFSQIHSKIFANDVSGFLPGFTNNTDFLAMSGDVIATFNTLRGENFELRLDDETFLKSTFVVHNFQNTDSLTYTFHISDFETKPLTIKYIAQEYLHQNIQEWSEFIDPLKNIVYQGKIFGTANRLSSEGILTSAFGTIKTNLQLERNIKTKKTDIKGNLKALPIYPSLFMSNPFLGEVAFNLNTKGYYSSTEGLQMDIDGMIQHIALKELSFDSIGITGNINKQMFTGRISSFDPKIRFDFDGILNFDTLPSYNFSMNMYYVNMFQLGFNKSDSLANLSFDLSANFVGNNFENSSGNISLTNLYYFYDTSYFATDSISLHIIPTGKGKKFNFSSEYLSAELEGHFNTLTVAGEMKSLLHHYLPSLAGKGKKTPTNDFLFTIVADYPHPLTELLSPEFRISPGSIITGRFDGTNNTLNFSIFSSRIEFFNRRIDELNLKAYTKNNKLFINLDSKEFRYTENTSLKNFMASSTIFNDSIKLNFNWNNWLAKNYSGNLNSQVTFKKTNRDYDLKFDLFPSNIVVLDTIWYLSKSQLLKDSSGITISGFKIDNSQSAISLNGKISENPDDSLQIELKNLNLTYLNPIVQDEFLIFGGEITGKTVVKDITRHIQINSAFEINNLSLNNELMGHTFIDSHWDQLNKKLDLNFKSLIDKELKTVIRGFYLAPEKYLDLDVDFNNQSVKLLRPFLEPTFTQIQGELNGRVKLFGTFPDLKWKGSVFTRNTSFILESNMVYYQVKDSIHLNDFSLIFKDSYVYDRENNHARVSGTISHRQFLDFFIDLKINTSKIQGLNTKASDNPLFYGKVYGQGYVKIYGPTDAINIDISATTLPNSNFYIPLEGKSDIQENSFIEFYNPLELKKSESEQQKILIENESETNLIMDLTVTPDVEVQIIFDPKIGDALKANGFAQLNMESIKGGFAMYGDYQISKGEFTFALQNVIHKKFEILAGSNVSWSGDPIDAQINLDAIYKVRRASVYDLTFDDADKDKKVEVDCHLKMADKLTNPTISFAVQVPATTNEAAIDQINTLPEEEINKQVLSLLLVNKFMPLYQQSYAPNTSGGLGATTVSELLSKQLSKWISQINTDFDLGFVYRPGTETTEQEYEVALSTNLWNDRITVNSNLGYTVQNQLATTTKNPYTTDFQIELKVNKKGNIRLRAFQKVNSDIEFSQAPYTQGIGIFYTEEFDDFNDLMLKMLRKSYATKPDEPQLKEDE